MIDRSMLLCMVVGTLVGVSRAVAAQPCRPADFSVTDLHWAPYGDGIAVTGTLHNNCAAPGGAEIQIVVSDAEGRPLTVQRFWPDSALDLPAGMPYQFWMPITVRGNVGSLRATVVKTEHWGQ